jgi:hypothetical protein
MPCPRVTNACMAASSRPFSGPWFVLNQFSLQFNQEDKKEQKTLENRLVSIVIDKSSCVCLQIEIAKDSHHVTRLGTSFPFAIHIAHGLLYEQYLLQSMGDNVALTSN